ncbi:hypothetical protein M433DRAFT_809 [Acidomyces richmondensis BFW]|nr:MAG: hypothetical protein FE78DRAFT_71540 [Acidomyces sp. 'richmondensis']KYG49764.1 hypothetical protein M433DRAFT_809 [Acidomyces richmondensis BFW]
MTDTFYPLPTLSSHEPSHGPVSTTLSFGQNPHYALPTLDGTQDDDGQISCFCGFPDDDGNTVACDICNRWNHTICYYPEYDGRELPKDLQHYCVECKPRPVDAQAAHARQRLKRERSGLITNGAKRQTVKSHKKKVKESRYTTNGWTLDKARHDRNSASPRDQPPPAKRPKTSHRTSESVTPAPSKGHARKRTVTDANHRRSFSRSPETSYDYYSAEFLRSYRDDSWKRIGANLHADIRISNTLMHWLQAPEEEFRTEIGFEKPELLMRWDRDLDDIPGKAEFEIQEEQDPNVVDEDGMRPSWKKVVITGEGVPKGGYIGELKGAVGMKSDYIDDPANRWEVLRHPEPFVFFHQRLPIYVDARNEGTELRFVRRSCAPNANLQVLITDNTTYRFCFMASQQIDPGTEVAIGWDTTPFFSNCHGGENLEPLYTRISIVLANCGPCACGKSDCMMSRFDRRGFAASHDDTPPVKMPASKKKKKGGNHFSPFLPPEFHSRSGSEARKFDQDDDPTDSRSTSGSAGRGSTSRDITPNTHYSGNVSLSALPEMSERERKKLAKEEEMFRRQEEEQNGRVGKKKRNSAGSSLNTPSATTAKQFGHSRNADAGTSRQSGLSSAKPISVKRGRAPTTLKVPKTTSKVIKRSRATYVDAEVQCDMDEVEAERRAVTNPPLGKIISVRQRLLERCARNNALSGIRGVIPKAERLVASPDATKVDSTSHDSPTPPSITGQPTNHDRNPSFTPGAESPNDVAQDDISVFGGSSLQTLSGVSETNRVNEEPSDQGAGPPAPPQNEMDDSHCVGSTALSHLHKPVEMHLQMPPPASNFVHVPGVPSAGTPNGVAGAIIQSPASFIVSAPLFSSSVNAVAAPSPARKKMSLSDYTKRSKAKDKDHETKERESSPASVASGPIAPSLKSVSSDAGKVGEGGATAVDDVKMEDAKD